MSKQRLSFVVEPDPLRPKTWYERQQAEREEQRRQIEEMGMTRYSQMQRDDDVYSSSDEDLVLPDPWPGRETPPLPMVWEASEEF